MIITGEDYELKFMLQTFRIRDRDIVCPVLANYDIKFTVEKYFFEIFRMTFSKNRSHRSSDSSYRS